MLSASKLLLRTSTSRSKLLTKVASLNTSPWANFEQGPPDPILGLNEAYQKDDFPQKVIVGVGAYRDDTGKPHVLSTVREAEYRLLEAKLDMEYAPITGDAAFVECALRFGYGADNLDIGGRIQGVQALSGTGGLRVMGELLAKHGHTQIAVPNPTWGNHIPIFQNAGLQVTKYRYVDNNTLDPEGMMQDIEALPEGTCVLLHACAHNPTGIDPTLDQWKELSQICQKKNLLPFFDCAYQGFASGDSEKDAAAIRMFLEDGHPMAMVQSFSKNFGLYGHRVGALSVVTGSTEEANKVVSQLKRVIRPMYSNPPRHGARIVSTILSDPALTSSFKTECKGMADRIITMRALLRSRLEDTLESSRPWNHITEQIGMFAYSGLTKEQVTALRDEHHVYCTMDGRISMAGVSSGNVDYIANAIHDVTK